MYIKKKLFCEFANPKKISPLVTFDFLLHRVLFYSIHLLNGSKERKPKMFEKLISFEMQNFHRSSNKNSLQCVKIPNKQAFLMQKVLFWYLVGYSAGKHFGFQINEDTVWNQIILQLHLDDIYINEKCLMYVINNQILHLKTYSETLKSL